MRYKTKWLSVKQQRPHTPWRHESRQERKNRWREFRRFENRADDGGGDQRNGCIKNRDQIFVRIEKEVVSDPRMRNRARKAASRSKAIRLRGKPSGRRVDGEGHRGVQLRWGIPALPIEALQCFENKKLMSASHLALPFLGIITAVSAPQGHSATVFSPSKGAAGDSADCCLRTSTEPLGETQNIIPHSCVKMSPCEASEKAFRPHARGAFCRGAH